MKTRLLLIWACLDLAGQTLPAQEGKDETSDLARLVRQLGSTRYREREAAMSALIQQRSPAALTQLRQAARSRDPEVNRRATEALVAVERALETERVLQPQKLRFDFKEVLVTDAVADFSRRTGLKATIAESDKTKLANRKITLDTGEVGLWEALRLLCRKGGLEERAPEVTTNRPGDPYDDIRGRRRVIWMYKDRLPAVPIEQIMLGDGSATRPRFDAGALRLQVLGRSTLAGPPPAEVTLTLGVDVEPRFGWNRLVLIRIDRGTDELGQKLTQPVMMVGDSPYQPSQGEEIFVVWDGMMEMPHWSTRQGTVRLRTGAKPAKTIKELRGTLAAEIEAPTSALVTVPDILKAGGKTLTGPEGSSVKVMEVKREESGQYMLQVEVKLPPKPGLYPEGFGGNVVWLNRGPVPAGGMVNVSATEVEQKGLALSNADGQPFILATGQYGKLAKPNDPIVYTLHYQPRKDQGPPVKLVLSGRRNVLVEVPFILHDVPLQ